MHNCTSHGVHVCISPVKIIRWHSCSYQLLFLYICYRVINASSPPVPDVELKGERGHYLFLVQGAESGGCTARLIHTANQINGAAALATLNALIREKAPPSLGMIIVNFYARSVDIRMNVYSCSDTPWANISDQWEDQYGASEKSWTSWFSGASFIKARLNPYGSLIYHWSGWGHLDAGEMRWQRSLTLLDQNWNISNVPNVE